MVDNGFLVEWKGEKNEGDKIKKVIAEILNKGRENALSKEVIKAMFGLKERQFYEILEQERIQGKLILSNNRKGGYYLPKQGSEGLEELKEYKRMTENRAKSTFYALKSVRKRIKELESVNA